MSKLRHGCWGDEDRHLGLDAHEFRVDRAGCDIVKDPRSEVVLSECILILLRSYSPSARISNAPSTGTH